MRELSSIPGYAAVVAHFGRWPSFHDAVLQSLILDEIGGVELQLQAWNMSSQVDERGYYILKDRAYVKFILGKVQTIRIDACDVWAGTVLFGLSVNIEGGNIKLVLNPALGVGGEIVATEVAMFVEPLSGER